MSSRDKPNRTEGVVAPLVDAATSPSRRSFLKFGASGVAAATVSTWLPQATAQLAETQTPQGIAAGLGTRRIRLLVAERFEHGSSY